MLINFKVNKKGGDEEEKIPPAPSPQKRNSARKTVMLNKNQAQSLFAVNKERKSFLNKTIDVNCFISLFIVVKFRFEFLINIWKSRHL